MLACRGLVWWWWVPLAAQPGSCRKSVFVIGLLSTGEYYRLLSLQQCQQWPDHTWIQLRPFLAESKYLMARGTWPHDVPDLRPHLVAGEQWQVAARGVQLVGQGLAWCVVPTLKGEYPISTIHLCHKSKGISSQSTQRAKFSFPRWWRRSLPRHIGVELLIYLILYYMLFIFYRYWQMGTGQCCYNV